MTHRRKVSDQQLDELWEAYVKGEIGSGKETVININSSDNSTSPVGTIIAFMGNNPPEGYLACDGSEYDILDYPQLAAHFLNEFGSYEHFGGGSGKFAVPDLRGEFLRGTGENSHDYGGIGEPVGEHQIPTAHLLLYKGSGGDITHPYGGWMSDNVDATYDDSFNYAAYNLKGTWAGGGPVLYTSRPTNTSVMYCIKAYHTENIYSTKERIVGTWIDGRPIYQKTYNNVKVNKTSALYTNAITIIDNIPNIDGIIQRNGYYIDSSKALMPFGYVTGTGARIALFARPNYDIEINQSIYTYDFYAFPIIHYVKKES